MKYIDRFGLKKNTSGGRRSPVSSNLQYGGVTAAYPYRHRQPNAPLSYTCKSMGRTNLIIFSCLYFLSFKSIR